MKKIDLSCDLGEASDERQQQVEDSIWPLITSANVACGAHAGDERTMRHAIEQARRYGVRLGAHPSYPDREHFGRRSMRLAPGELRETLIEQIDALASLAEGGLTHVKPHGALYNDAHHDEELARVVAVAVFEYNSRLAMVSAASSALHRAAQSVGLPFIAEAFGDRRYRSDGSLVPRSEEGALLLDLEEAARQALSLALSEKVRAENGASIRVPFDTICIHGDMEGSPERLRLIRRRLLASGFMLQQQADSGY